MKIVSIDRNRGKRNSSLALRILCKSINRLSPFTLVKHDSPVDFSNSLLDRGTKNVAMWIFLQGRIARSECYQRHEHVTIRFHRRPAIGKSMVESIQGSSQVFVTLPSLKATVLRISLCCNFSSVSLTQYFLPFRVMNCIDFSFFLFLKFHILNLFRNIYICTFSFFLN